MPQGSERTRQLRWWERLWENFAQTKVGGWLAVNVAHHIDKRIVRWSKGKLSLSPGQPVGLLETVGARSGDPRTTPLLYLDDGERYLVVASKAGAAKNPAWYHNVRANPDIAFTPRDGRRRELRARITAGAERDNLWARVNDLYTGYETYQERAGARTIPVVALEPAEASPGATSAR